MSRGAQIEEGGCQCVCHCDSVVNGLDVLAGGLVAAAAILRIIFLYGNFQSTYVNCWGAAFGISYASLTSCKFSWASIWTPFLLNNLGRGLWLIFLGALTGSPLLASSSTQIGWVYVIIFITFYVCALVGIIHVVFYIMGTFCGTNVPRSTTFTSPAPSARYGKNPAATRDVRRV